jgi:hypothetical protein
VAWALFASLFYKTIMLMLLFLVWKKHIFEMLPAWTQKWGMKPYWMLFFVCLWMAMPRYRIDSNDRVRLVSRTIMRIGLDELPITGANVIWRR